MYETAGKMKWIGTTQTFPSGFSKREFVVTTAHDKYPQDIKFDMVKDKCPLLDGFEPGQDVQVSFDIRGREYNGKYFVDLSCWKLQPADGTSKSATANSGEPSRRQSQPATGNEPSAADLRSDGDFDDESPF